MDSIHAIAAVIVAFIATSTSIFAQHINYARGAFSEPEQTVTVLFAGDMMFDRSVRVAMDAHGGDHVFSCMHAGLTTADFVVANLEGPITPFASKSVGSVIGSPDNFVFTFPEYVAPLLARHNIRAVSLGNNHIMNFGTAGLITTKASLERAGVAYFGEPGTLSVAEVDEKGIGFTFIGFNLFDSGSTASSTIAQISDAREKGRIPIVFAHWGDEYVPANAQQKRLARRFVDAGAQLVIGAHPHIVQEHEQYNGAHIYYSLGNFVFDQYWNDSVRTGMLVSVVFGTHGVVTTSESYSYLERDRRTCPKPRS